MYTAKWTRTIRVGSVVHSVNANPTRSRPDVFGWLESGTEPDPVRIRPKLTAFCETLSQPSRSYTRRHDKVTMRSLDRVSDVLGRVHTRTKLYPTRVPFANGSRRLARVHTASTASGSSGTLRPHQEVFAVDANGTRRVCAAV